MAIGDIVSDADLSAMAPVTTEATPATFSDAEIAAMEDQSKAVDSLNSAASSVASPSPLSGPSSPSPFAPTGLGPTQPKTFSTQELDHLEADSLNDPSVDLSRDQWDSAMAARKRVGSGFIGSALSNISGGIGGLIQTTYGGIKDLMRYPKYQGDFGDYAQKTLEHETGVANSWLQGVRNAGMQTMLGIQQAKQGFQGLVDGSADAGLVNATPEQIKAGADAGYGNYLDNNAFKREIEHPTITSVPQIVSMAAPDAASGQPVQQALAASFNNPATAPLKDLTDLSAMVAAPENQVAGAAGALISKVPIGNMVKYASGRVLQGLGNTTIVANDALDNVAKAAIDRVNAVIPSVKIGDKVYDGADVLGAAGTGALGLTGWSAASHGDDGGNPLWSAMKPVLGYLALRKGAAVVRTIGQGAQVTGTILREAGDVMGPLRQDALGAVASNPGIPAAYRTAAADAVATGGTGAIDSTMSRVANSPDYPAWIRRVAARANNPIITGASRVAGSAVEGGVAGSLAMIPLTIGQDEEQAGANVGAGFGFGAAGGLASRVLGNSARQRNQDVARFLADTAISGGDVVKVAQLPTGRLQNLAAIQGLLSLKGTEVIPLDNQPKVDPATGKVIEPGAFDKQVGAALSNQPGIAPADVVPLDGTDFSANVAALGGRGAAGWFLDAAPGQRARVFINLDADHPAEIHEGLGHAILASNVMEGAQRSDARNFIQQLYGDAGIEARAREYAQRQVEAEEASLRQRAAAAGQPIPSFPPLEDRITQRVQNLSENSLAAGDEHPLDWARDEVFAEHMNQAGIDVNSIRRGLPANVDPDAATRSILAMNARSLAAQGVSIDPQTGKVVGSLSSIFRDNPLVGSSPTLSKQLARYVSSYDSWLNGIDLGARRTEGTQIAPSGSPYDMARSNLVNLRPVPGKPGVFENDFLRNDNGTVTFKPQSEIKQTDELRKAQLASAVGTSLRAKNDPVLGPRMVDGKKVISGSQLPATMGALQHFGPWIQSIANTWRNDAGQGGVYRLKVNRVGTGDTGSYKVINLGNIRSITRNFWEPFEYSVSKEGHLLAHTIDDSAVQRNILKGINDGLLPHHNNDAGAMRESLMTYLDNHKRNLPSENGIGIGKRNEINAVLTSFSKNHRNINPLAANFGPQGVVRRIRMDRIEDMSRVVNQDKGSPTYGQPLAGFHFDYFKVNNNMMPAASERPAGQVMPYLGGEVVPSKVSDQYDSSRIGSAMQGKVKPTTQDTNVGIHSVDPNEMAKQMATLTTFDKGIPLPASIASIKDPQAKAQSFINFIKTNLISLHDAFPEELRARATLWYDGARKIAENISEQNGITKEQAAGIMAAFSPMKDWFQNVAMAERFSKVFAKELDTVITRAEFGDALSAITDSAEDSKARARLLSGIVGKSIRQLWEEGEHGKNLAAWATRVVAQQRFGLQHDVLAPEGHSLGVRYNKDGKNTKTLVWQSADFIKKALSIGFDGSLENISKEMGVQHKIRSFYNNIIAPNSPFGDVTIDTHAVNAGVLFPMGNKGTLVSQNFGEAGVAGGGNKGTYWLYHEAYKQAAKELGLQPRQLQSITWEAVRGLFPDDLKGTKNFDGKVQQIWENALDENAARKQILELGIRRPEWARTNSGSGGIAEAGPSVSRKGAGKKANAQGSGSNRTGQGLRSRQVDPEIGRAIDVLKGRKGK